MKFDLDVDDPRKVYKVLRAAAQRFAEDSSELDSAWQDTGAGRPWRMIAMNLERAADAIEKQLHKMGF